MRITININNDKKPSSLQNIVFNYKYNKYTCELIFKNIRSDFVFIDFTGDKVKLHSKWMSNKW